MIKIMNLYFPQTEYRSSPVLRTTAFPAQKKEPQFKNVLLVGTSFLFGLHERLSSHPDFGKITHFFYDRSVRVDPKTLEFNPVDYKTLDWKQTLNVDVIVIENNYAFASRMGKDFAEFALKALEE